jgi:hypothetical protein
VNLLSERYDGEVPDIIDDAYAVVDFDDGASALLTCACPPRARAAQGSLRE